MSELERFFDDIFGDVEGYLWIGWDGSRTNRSAWKERQYEWPLKREAVLAFARSARAESDVYFCTSLLRPPTQGKHTRKRSSAALLDVLHADFDHPPTDPDLYARLAPLRIHSGGTDENGWPKEHAYLRLAEPTDEPTYKYLCDLWRARLGGDAKIDPRDMLRLPETLNHKSDPPGKVRVASRGTWDTSAWTVDELIELLKPTDGSSTRDRRLDVRIDSLDLSDTEAAEWLEQHGEGAMCRAVTNVTRTQILALGSASSRHDSARDGCYALLNLAVEGHRGATTALGKLGEAFAEAIGRDREGAAEWKRMVAGGIRAAAARLKELDDGFGWEQHDADRCGNQEPTGSTGGVRSSIRWASSIKPERAQFAWSGRIPVGELTLLAGREGVGKSTVAYQIAADLSRGQLDGEFFGTPQRALVVATEDSMPHTIVPRLGAAGADLDMIGQLEFKRANGAESPLALDLQSHLDELRRAIDEHNFKLLIFDPFMSRLGRNLDSHKDAEVRVALEPLVAIAQASGCAVIGIMHLNKSGSGDPLTNIMGSVAFAAVARAVLYVAEDPHDASVRVVGQAKNNLGPLFAGVMPFSLETESVATDDGGKIETSVLRWHEADESRSIRDVINESRNRSRGPTVAEQAAQWLVGYLSAQPDKTALRRQVLTDGEAAGWSADHINKARRRLGSQVASNRAREKGGPASWTLQDEFSDGGGA